ncbi:MAG: undecaprenyl-diphosphate phosphatase [Candidatus Dojkabacteria bacterium]|nr:undecaprenyl-diphosphate phosphatase [Candidatus Dojkabacteria bacterium]
MENIKLLVLAIVQGISELLPVSSSGHLIFLGHLMEIDVSTLLLTTLHLGTSIALVIFFRKTLFKDLFTKKKISFYLKILISIIPIAIIGAVFEHRIEEALRAHWIIAAALIFWGVVMIVVDNVKIKVKYKSLEDIPLGKSIIIGVSQIFALIPGTSRSAVSTITGILLGLDKFTSLEYTFIMGIPVLLGSSIWEILKNIQGTDYTLPPIVTLLIVLVVPLIVGYICLLLLKRVKKNKWLTVFGIYRIIIGLFILIF